MRIHWKARSPLHGTFSWVARSTMMTTTRVNLNHRFLDAPVFWDCVGARPAPAEPFRNASISANSLGYTYVTYETCTAQRGIRVPIRTCPRGIVDGRSSRGARAFGTGRRCLCPRCQSHERIDRVIVAAVVSLRCHRTAFVCFNCGHKVRCLRCYNGYVRRRGGLFSTACSFRSLRRWASRAIQERVDLGQ